MVLVAALLLAWQVTKAGSAKQMADRLNTGHAIALTRALPKKWRFMKLDCSQPLAMAKACDAAKGFFSM